MYSSKTEGLPQISRKGRIGLQDAQHCKTSAIECYFSNPKSEKWFPQLTNDYPRPCPLFEWWRLERIFPWNSRRRKFPWKGLATLLRLICHRLIVISSTNFELYQLKKVVWVWRKKNFVLQFLVWNGFLILKSFNMQVK